MIKCNSPFRYSDICVACMDAQQSCGGTIICDIAEDYDYEEQDILVCCKYGELINKDLAEVKNIMTLFEKITKDKKALAEYLLECCDNPLYECNEDMCELCDRYGSELSCNNDSCIDAIVKGLDSEVN